MISLWSTSRDFSGLTSSHVEKCLKSSSSSLFYSFKMAAKCWRGLPGQFPECLCECVPESSKFLGGGEGNICSNFNVVPRSHCRYEMTKILDSLQCPKILKSGVKNQTVPEGRNVGAKLRANGENMSPMLVRFF